MRIRAAYSANMTADLRDELMDKLQKVPLSHFEQNDSSQITRESNPEMKK